MKKLLAIVLAAVMAFGVFAFTGCSDKTGKSDFKVGAILIGDENEGYTYAHIQGIEAAKKPATSAMIRSSTNTTSPRTKSAMKQQSTSRNRAASSSSQTPSVMRITSSAPQKSIPTLFSATQPVKRLQSIPSLTTFSTILTASTKLAMFPASLRA